MFDELTSKIDKLSKDAHGLLSKTENISGDVKGKVNRFFDKVRKGTESLPEPKRTSWWERAKIVAGAFWSEILGIGREKQKASNEANNKVSTTTSQAMGKMKELSQLEESVKGREREVFDESFANVAAVMDQNLDDTQKGLYQSAFEKIADPSKGPLTAAELKVSSAVTFLSLHGLKQAYPGTKELTEFFKNFQKAAGKSRLKNLFGEKVLAVFDIGDTEGLKVLKVFGISASVGDLFGKGEASEFAETMQSIESPGNPKKAEIVKTLKEKGVLKHNVPRVVTAMHELVTSGVKPATLAKVVHAVDNSDLLRLGALFLGKKVSDIKPVKIPNIEKVKAVA